MSIKLKPCRNRLEAYPRLNEAAVEFEETVEQPVKPFKVGLELKAHFDPHQCPGDYSVQVGLSLTDDKHDQYWRFYTLAKTKEVLPEYLEQAVLRRYPTLSGSIKRLLSRTFAWLDELPQPWPWWTDGTFIALF
jgi:hypothetical protein